MERGARPMRSTRRLQNAQGSQPRWWSITNKADTSEPTLVSIFDEIGFFGVSAGGFLAELSGIDGDIDLHLNSPGGDVFDAIAIYNSLKARRGTVAITVDGLAASAASFIAQAASPGHLEMAPFSTMMIHDGFAAGIGNAADMRDLAQQLDDASDNIAGIYAQRTGKTAEYWRNKMRATTWYKDHEAVADGLADRVRGQDGAVKDAWDLSVLNAVPAPAENTPAPAPAPRETVTLQNKAPDPAAVENPAAVPAAVSAIDNSVWDAAKAWHNATQADDPEAFYAGICAGKKTGDPDTQNAWALPYRYHPDDPPNAAGVRAALARLSGTQGLINKAEARDTLETAMTKINPDYKPGDTFDGGLLSAVLLGALEGSNK
jgi:ATP-dependent protease ClpP protease subunit